MSTADIEAVDRAWTADEARGLIDRLRELLASGGFGIRQPNQPEASNQVVSHLPKEAQFTHTKQWLSQMETEVPESNLGLQWYYPTNSLRYKHHPLEQRFPISVLELESWRNIR